MDVFSYLLGKESSGGGGGSSLDWQAIGFSGEPQSVVDAYNYAKTIQKEYNNTKSYSNNRNIIFFPYVDCSERAEFAMMFRGCSSLTDIALLDLSAGDNLTSMFNNCEKLTYIPQFDTSSATSFVSMFNYCSKLVNVPILDTSNVTSMQWTFSNCSSLSDTSLNNILKMCINATKITSNKTLQYIGLSSTQATTCQSLSNYQDFLDAGWTTGY